MVYAEDWSNIANWAFLFYEAKKMRSETIARVRRNKYCRKRKRKSIALLEKNKISVQKTKGDWRINTTINLIVARKVTFCCNILSKVVTN